LGAPLKPHFSATTHSWTFKWVQPGTWECVNAGNCLLIRIVEKVADFHGVAIVELMNLLFQFSDQFSRGFDFLGGGHI